MQESTRYAVGIDVGTTSIKVVIGNINLTDGATNIVGVGCVTNHGMRKGVITDLTGPARAIDEALGDAERMSGHQVESATMSINGQHILSTKADGMVAVGSSNHEVTNEDIVRLEDVATIGKIPANREIVEIVPYSYKLDGESNIKDPIGMIGTRLEIDANIVSVLSPYFANLKKAAEMAKVYPRAIKPSAIAAAKSVLNEEQVENGVAVIDIGGSTTSIAIFEEGDLQYTSVIPIGGINITNDLAIGLKTEPDIAEEVKIKYSDAISRNSDDTVSIKKDKGTYEFEVSTIDNIVEARLEEIFELVQKEFKKAGRAGKLPNGAVLVGGTSNMNNIDEYAKKYFGLAVKIGHFAGFGGVVDKVNDPKYAAAIGLMLFDGSNNNELYKKNGVFSMKKANGFISAIISKFKK
jgi:cell division protein FtsA